MTKYLTESGEECSLINGARLFTGLRTLSGQDVYDKDILVNERGASFSVRYSNVRGGWMLERCDGFKEEALTLSVESLVLFNFVKR